MCDREELQPSAFVAARLAFIGIPHTSSPRAYAEFLKGGIPMAWRQTEPERSDMPAEMEPDQIDTGNEALVAVGDARRSSRKRSSHDADLDHVASQRGDGEETLEESLARMLEEIEPEEDVEDDADDNDELHDVLPPAVVDAGQPFAVVAQPDQAASTNSTRAEACEDQAPHGLRPGTDELALPRLKITRHGAFTFTAKKGSKNPGFQATCPFHRKNNTTECKHFIQARGGTDADKREAMHKLLFWCLQHLHHDRVWSHQRCHVPEVSDLPHASALWRQIGGRVRKDKSACEWFGKFSGASFSSELGSWNRS